MGLKQWGRKDPWTIEDFNQSLLGIDKEISDRGVNARWKGAKGDGTTNDTQGIIDALQSLKDGDTLIFPPRTYFKTSKTGFLTTITKLSNVTIIGNGSTIEVVDEGISITYSKDISISGLKIVRSSQALWGAGKTAIYVGNSSHVDIKHNEISKFTDALAITFCNTVNVYKNKLHHLGEEPVVSRLSQHVTVSDNEAYTYLGDGVLNKGTSDMTVARNFLHDPINKYLNEELWRTFVPVLGNNIPNQGGGITSNAESGVHPNLNMNVDNNHIYGCVYGVILSAVSVASITKNYIKDVGHAAGIAVSDSAGYNPNKIAGLDIVVHDNTIDGFSTLVPQPAIQLKTGAVLVNRAIISYNKVYPRGPHKGIVASGDIQVVGNTIEGAELSIELLDGAKAFQNFIFDSYQLNYGRAISLYGRSIASNNTIKSSCPVILWGNDASLSNNQIECTSETNYAVVVQPGISGNQIIDNTISSVALKEIGVGDPDWRDKNVYSGWIIRGEERHYIPRAARRIAIRPTSLDTGRVPGATFLDTNLENLVTWSGTKWIESNSGKAVFSGDGTSVTVTIPHGLSIRPTSYVVSPASNDAGFAEIRNVDADATNIIVRFKNALYAGSNNVSLCWFAESK